MTMRGLMACTFCLPIAFLHSNALQSTPPHQPRSDRVNICASGGHTTALNAFFTDERPSRNNERINLGKVTTANGTPYSPNFHSNEDIFQTLQLKDEALRQAQTAVSSLESALESAVVNLEKMQQNLKVKVTELEKELDSTKEELRGAKIDLEETKRDLRNTRADLEKSNKERNNLKRELGQSKNALRQTELRVQELEASMGEDDGTAFTPRKKPESNPWQLWTSSALGSFPVLNEWTVIKGSSEGEVQISGRVTNHPDIPDGDAIVTSPLKDASQAVEKKIVTTLSGSKYKLGKPMVMPGTNPSGERASLAKSGSISIPDLSGETIGNGRYLLSGAATPSVNGRSFIQAAYRANPSGNPIGEALIIKVSANKEAMKREFANYQKVLGSMKKGCFIRRHEFLPVAGKEMPDKSCLVMQRGIADVKAFMPTMGGRLEGDLLLDCAVTALRCVEALHAAKLVWNDLKTENFVVVEDEKTGGICFRGIDLESCMPVKSTPVDYTPEACPPEFASSFVRGEAGSFLLEYSYDVWSYGMFLYEISTGRGFFDGMSAQKITQILPNFEPNVDKVEDPQLADLILKCLSQDPRDRPSFVRISKHPYFTNSSPNKNPSLFNFFQI